MASIEPQYASSNCPESMLKFEEKTLQQFVRACVQKYGMVLLYLLKTESQYAEGLDIPL